MANTAFNHDPALTVAASNTTAGAAVKWVASKNLGESLIILDSGGNGRIGLAGDLDLITLTANTVTVAGTVAATAYTGDGSSLTGISGTTINNNADNRVITGSGTANTLEGEATLTFGSNALSFDNDHDGNNAINLINDSNTASASTRLTIQTAGASAGDAVALFHAGGDSYIIGVDNSDSNKFKIAATGGNLGTNDVLIITSAGDVGIGATTTTHRLFVEKSLSGNDVAAFRNTHGSTPQGIEVEFSAAAPDNNSQTFLHCTDNAASRLMIWADGDISNHDGSYGSLSDERKKENIVDMPNTLGELDKLRMRKFSWKDDSLSEPNMYGVVAQEALASGAVLPEKFIKQNRDGFYTAYYSHLVPMLVKAIQELKAKIETLGG